MCVFNFCQFYLVLLMFQIHHHALHLVGVFSSGLCSLFIRLSFRFICFASLFICFSSCVSITIWQLVSHQPLLLCLAIQSNLIQSNPTPVFCCYNLLFCCFSESRIVLNSTNDSSRWWQSRSVQPCSFRAVTLKVQLSGLIPYAAIDVGVRIYVRIGSRK